jgi:hypothetical protein
LASKPFLLGLGTVVVALWIAVGVARADGSFSYHTGTWGPGQTISSNYDYTCYVANYLINYDEFDKGNLYYGRVMFIDGGGTWHRVVSGNGTIFTTEPNDNYKKKASSVNTGGISISGSALFGYQSLLCT